MSDLQTLITALNIFLKYGNPDCPTHCEHDVLYVNIDPEIVSEEDKNTLDELGFFPDEEYGEGFASFRFGSS